MRLTRLGDITNDLYRVKIILRYQKKQTIPDPGPVTRSFWCV